jgi:hypothetical protein
MNVDSHKPRFARRLALLGVSAVLGATGLGAYLVVSAKPVSPIHLTSAVAPAAAASPAKVAPRAAASVADPDTIQLQQGDQSGQQDNSGGPDTTTASTSESTGSEPDSAGGHADAAGSAGQQGDFNN